MMIGMGLGGHFNKALEESGKETFTKEDLILIHAKAVMEFCESFAAKMLGFSLNLRFPK